MKRFCFSDQDRFDGNQRRPGLLPDFKISFDKAINFIFMEQE